MDSERMQRWLQMMILEADATPEEWQQFDAFVQRIVDRNAMRPNLRLVGDGE